MRNIAIIFLTALSCAILLVWLLITRENPMVREMGKELGKLTIQVALVVVVGGIIVQEYNRRRQRTTAINEFRKTVLRNLVHSYSGAKKSRRLLRARRRVRRGLNGEMQMELSRLAYEEQMGSISETQLELEILILEIVTFFDAFSKSKEIRRCLDKMEEYLGTLINEYETALSDLEESEYISLDRLERLNDFIHGRKDSYFRSKFTQSFHSALSLIQAERLKVN